MDLCSVEIQSVHLQLRSFLLTDAPELHAALSWNITRYMAIDPAPSLEVFLDIGRSWIAGMAAGHDLYLVVRARRSGEFLGMTGVHGIDAPPAEAGIWIRESAQGSGHGCESVRSAVRWARAHAGVGECLYPVAEANLPSRRIAERLAGQVVGGRSLVKSDGEVHPLVVYQLGETL